MQKNDICIGNSKTKCIKVPFNFKMFCFFSFFYLHLQLALPLHGALYKIKIMCKITGNKSHSAGVLRTMQNFLFFLTKYFSAFLKTSHCLSVTFTFSVITKKYFICRFQIFLHKCTICYNILYISLFTWLYYTYQNSSALFCHL